MEYDVENHLPQQMEMFLGYYAQGEVSGMIRTKSTMQNILKIKDVTKDLTIRKWDDIRDVDGEKLRKQLITLKEQEQKIVDELNEMEDEYWNNLRDLFPKSVKQDETVG